MITLFKKDGQWYARQRKRVGPTTAEVTTVPITPEQAIVIRTKFGGVYEEH